MLVRFLFVAFVACLWVSPLDAFKCKQCNDKATCEATKAVSDCTTVTDAKFCQLKQFKTDGEVTDYKMSCSVDKDKNTCTEIKDKKQECTYYCDKTDCIPKPDTAALGSVISPLLLAFAVVSVLARTHVW